MNIKVSIVVPAYNREKEIVGCLKSLLNQTLKEIEIIVVDDGSTDNTAAVARSLADERIRVIQTENRGQGLARNTGIEAAEGKYIAFVDSDDDVSCVMYEKMYEIAEKYNTDMVQCCNAFIKGDKTDIMPLLENEFVEINDSYKYVKNYYYERKHTKGPCNKLFKAEFLKENNLWFPDTKVVHCEDLMFNLCLLEKLRRVYFMKDALYNYYVSDAGHFRNTPEARLLKICTLYEQTLEIIKNKKIKRAVKSEAADLLFTYITVVLESDTANQIIKSSMLRDFTINMMLYERTLRHTLFSVVFILAPVKLKKYILKKIYSKYII